MPAFDVLSDAQIESLVDVLKDLWKDRPDPGERIVAPPRPPASPPHPASGAEVYRRLCLLCHGERGRGDGPAAAGLSTRPRNLAAGELKAGSDPEQLFVRVSVGIPPLMPEFRKVLTPEEIWAVVHYLESEFLGRY